MHMLGTKQDVILSRRCEARVFTLEAHPHSGGKTTWR